MSRPLDPAQAIIYDALVIGKYSFKKRKSAYKYGCDFYLPELALTICIKQVHSEKIIDHILPMQDVIVIQGISAARTFSIFLCSNSLRLIDDRDGGC
jgi:hypothetical protein